MDFDFSGYAPGLKLNPLFVEIPIGIDITTPFSVFGFPENFKEKSGAKQKLLLLGASAGVQAEIFLSHIGIAFGGGIQYLRFSGFKNRDDSVSDMTRFNRGIYSRFAVGSLICRF